jgi:hypothetical protein
MKKIVTVINTITGMRYAQAFYSYETMNAWIAKQETKCSTGKSWGWRERRMHEADCPTNLVSLIVEVYPVLIAEAYVRDTGMLDENGDPIFENVEAVYQSWVRLKPEYEITITDATTEHDAELAAIEARRGEIAQLKQAYNIIDGWTSLNDINLSFLKKFFKRILKEMRD